MNFEKLTYIREINDLKQKDIAKLLNVNQSTISNWENGIEVIPLKKLYLFTKHFNVSIDYIFNLSKEISYNINFELNKNIIGSNLKKFRKNNNITQEKLADLLNTTHSTISAYESGKTLILTSFLYQICNNYKISAYQILKKQ